MFRLFISAWISLLLLLSSQIGVLNTAFGHESQIIDGNGGGIQVIAGWKFEPPLRGEMNEIQLQFQNVSDGKPISNAIADLAVSIARGQLSQQLYPSPQSEPGLYSAPVIPTLTGDYSIVLKGAIGGKAIAGMIEIEDVEDACRLQFPRDPACGTVVEPPIYPFEEIFKRIDTIEENVASLNETINGLNELTGSRVFELSEGLQGISNTAYLMGAVGIATGVAGLALALISLLKRK